MTAESCLLFCKMGSTINGWQNRKYSSVTLVPEKVHLQKKVYQWFLFSGLIRENSANIYLFKGNNTKMTNMFIETCYFNFEHISHLILVFLLLTLNK